MKAEDFVFIQWNGVDTSSEVPEWIRKMIEQLKDTGPDSFSHGFYTKKTGGTTYICSYCYSGDTLLSMNGYWDTSRKAWSIEFVEAKILHVGSNCNREYAKITGEAVDRLGCGVS